MIYCWYRLGCIGDDTKNKFTCFPIEQCIKIKSGLHNNPDNNNLIHPFVQNDNNNMNNTDSEDDNNNNNINTNINNNNLNDIIDHNINNNLLDSNDDSDNDHVLNEYYEYQPIDMTELNTSKSSKELNRKLIRRPSTQEIENKGVVPPDYFNDPVKY